MEEEGEIWWPPPLGNHSLALQKFTNLQKE